MKYQYTESVTLELKRELPNNNQIVKSIIGFCNQNGGRLIVGVADDGNIIGIPDEGIEKTIESIESSIFDACMPTIIPRIATQMFGEKRVIVIEVSEGMNKPYYRRSEGLQKGTYIRLGKFTARATPEIIRELAWQSQGIDFESLPAYQATKDDLDLEAFRDFLKNRINHGKTQVSEKTLKAYNVIVYEHTKTYPSTLGILLFGRSPQTYFSEAMIICTHFRGVSGRDAIATTDCEGTLFEQFEKAHAFIIERLHRAFEITGLKRTEVLEIPEVAIREALLNSVVHRNYHIKAPTKIAIYDDRIEFFSPGQFPGPLDTENLLAGISYLRNPMICKIMREVGYVEKLGTGFIQIFKSYDARDLQTPTVIEGENYIKYVLPRYRRKPHIELTDDIEKIKQLFVVQPEVNITDVMRALSISRSTALRRLNDMIASGLIARVGEKKAIRYRRVFKR